MNAFVFNIVRRLFTWFACAVYNIKRYINPRDYEVERVYMYYTLDIANSCTVVGQFWNDELDDKWQKDQTEYVADITDLFVRGKRLTLPDCVSNVRTCIKYYYNAVAYKTIIDEHTQWPGKNPASASSFSLPIKSAWLLGEDGEPVHDVTKKIKRYAGPRNDFHGRDVHLRDTGIRRQFSTVRITNVLGQVVTLSEVIRPPLQFSLPGKT